MRVMNVGIGRTGTQSVKAALELLGLGPCYNMEDAWGQPGHLEIWESAFDGQAVDWEALLGDYGSGVDFPICSFWEELVEAFPEASIILTVRDAHRWFDSYQATLRAAQKREMPPIPLVGRWQQLGIRSVERLHPAGDLDNREVMVAAFERHNRRVLEAVTDRTVLVYDVKDGWGPLCNHLGLELPSLPFPHTNDRDWFQSLLGVPTDTSDTSITS
jgi:hypothetical protein